MVIIPKQEKVEVFANKNDSVTIRQVDVLTGEDAIIVIQPEHVPAIVKALRLAAKEAGAK